MEGADPRRGEKGDHTMQKLMGCSMLVLIMSAAVLSRAYAGLPEAIVSLEGKIEIKYSTEPNKREVVIEVYKAKTNAGIPYEELKGRIIKIKGKLTEQAGKLDGKIAIVEGLLKNDKTEIEVKKIKKLIPKIQD